MQIQYEPTTLGDSVVDETYELYKEAPNDYFLEPLFEPENEYRSSESTQKHKKLDTENPEKPTQTTKPGTNTSESTPNEKLQ